MFLMPSDLFSMQSASVQVKSQVLLVRNDYDGPGRQSKTGDLGWRAYIRSCDCLCKIRHGVIDIHDKMDMDVDDPPEQMDLALDPSLSLNAEGLWSDEESMDSAPSDLEEETPRQMQKRKAIPG
jgi:hypothetical protein